MSKKKKKRRATCSATSEIGSHISDIIQVFIVRAEAFQGFIKCIVRTESFQGFINVLLELRPFRVLSNVLLELRPFRILSNVSWKNKQVKNILCSVNQDSYIWADQKNKQDQFLYTCVSATV